MTTRGPYKLLTRGRGRGGRSNIFAYVLGALALLLVAGGCYTTYSWYAGGGIGGIFPSDTPTPTITLTPSLTPTVTETPTETAIPSSPTASAPFLYQVASGDTISSIADQFGVDYIIIMILNGLNNSSVIQVGQELIIPDPNMDFPEPTPLPENLRRGDEILYLVLPGDSLALIAERYLSTVADILTQNGLDNANNIFVGQLLTIRVMLITPTPGPSPTPLGTTGPIPTVTPSPTVTP
ncbi:MAG: LysM peptidoglycan-binding domain-containing protein [Anaerolineales bacterium]|nr:LysM peptidoglycan-binding domain-containing protein [Anaerolineales bacterium]